MLFGKGCCEISVPPARKNIQDSVKSFRYEDNMRNRCSYAFVADEWEMNFTVDIKPNKFDWNVTMKLEWAIGESNFRGATYSKSYVCGGKNFFEKPGRHESEEKTKVHWKGYLGILEWKGNIHVRDWAVKFNNLIGFLLRDPSSINIAHNFEEQEFKGIKKIWEKLMDHYCIEDNTESWDYVIPKMAKLIRGWKSDLKKRYFTNLFTDWKRIYELDKRVPPFNWMTLIIEWEGEKKIDYF
ncbi:uncharacterized protein A4U43_UnF7190 [Asparagus officinalis]|uniref:Uncharacterized protein n=1 Tax=Asparagus officinalis TaxID=4686 RepID=A0A1R3L6B1_ASPOF|nr:uncharacterized protein A4U43_UnF7190 [Asparagus officinalis]